MKNKKGLAALSSVILITFFVAIPAFGQEVIKWKAQAWVGIGTTEYAVFEDFCKKVKLMTNGKIEIAPYPAGAIVPTFECLTAVQNNVMQATINCPAYWSGKDPVFAALGDLTAAWTHSWEVDTFFNYLGGLDMLREAYKPFDVYCVGVLFCGLESMPSKKPMRKVEDFKGKKWRCAQGMTAEWFSKMGASVVIMPAGEIYSALEKGVVDGCDWGTPNMNYKQGFYQIAKYFNYPGFHSLPTVDFSVNMKEWSKLPPDLKQMLQTAVRELAWDMIEREGIEDIKAVEAMKAAGATPVSWSEDELVKARNIASGIWDQWAKKSPSTKKVIDAKKDWLRRLGKIK